LQTIALLPGVAKVRPVLRYQLDLSETVPYVGAKAAQTAGKDGTGVRVAVLDSGVDYTHRNLGGAGTLAAYEAAYGTGTADPRNTTRDGLFPTAKVIAGHDFVGEAWPNTPEAPDDDPIDFDGHGTHVADIIAGASADGAHKGVAPGASLVALKVCSSIATSCSGIALLQAMDFALDPNGDGDTRDAVDVINMSLGSSYGQIEDDLTLASANAVRLGVVVVTSAGNSADRPYIVGSPSTGVGVISVAQTQVPSATAVPLVVNAPASIAGVYRNTEMLAFAPIDKAVTQDVVFVGRGCPANSGTPTGAEDPYLVSPAGKIALIDRGACAVSLKVDRAAKAGAAGVLIGLVAAGDAITFSFGGGDTFVPSLVIQQVLSNAIKARLNAPEVVNASISPAAAIPLVGGMVGSSSRGPAYSTQHIKPEIGAPGASLSAEVGTGTGQTAFGGTSGAAPMVSGAAALLVQAFPKESPERIKARLMNSAETAVFTSPAVRPGDLAPITRIGAGELRVDRALALGALAWNRESRSAALSFGAIEVAQKTTVERSLRIENRSGHSRSFTITPTFRYADDAASGAVRVLAPSRVHVGAHDSEEIDVKLVIDPAKLASWTLNGGSRGGSGNLLNGPEFDGYLTLTAGSEKLSVPWHVLPRKAAESVASLSDGRRSAALRLSNRGAEVGDFELFSLTGTSRRAPRDSLPPPGSNLALIDMRAVGVRHLQLDFGFGPEDYLEFAISTQGRRAHPNYPAEFDIFIDTNGDGIDDFVAFNLENGGFAVSGQNVVALVDLATGAGSVLFFADADLNSGNMIFTVPMNDSTALAPNLGVKLGQTIGFSVFAFDNYFSGALTDQITGMKFTPGMARYDVGALPFGSVAPFGKARIDIAKAKVPNAKSSETGVLVMHRRNAGKEADALRADDDD
jgi:minor extracellular serine protease Vpr